MPTLEDTVDFQVPTLNDLLDADARRGAAPAADDKYKRWAFLSSGLAVMLAIGLVVSLVTGGGDDGGGGGGKAIKAPAGTQALVVDVGDNLSSDIAEGSVVSVLDEAGQVISSGVTVLKITEGKEFAGRTPKKVELAIPTAEVSAVRAADAAGTLSVVSGTLEKTTPTTAAPAAETPAPIEPAPVPVDPATTPSS